MTKTSENPSEFCEVCQYQKYDVKHGLICELTDKVADSEGPCSSFSEDPELRIHIDSVNAKQYIHDHAADLGIRVLNFLIDYVFLSIFFISLGLLLTMYLPQFYETLFGTSKLISYLTVYILIWNYFTIWEFTNGRTLGKLLTQTRVVTLDCKQPGYKTSAIRSLCRLIPLEPLSFLGEETNGWHDRLSGTTVIKG